MRGRRLFIALAFMLASCAPFGSAKAQVPDFVMPAGAAPRAGATLDFDFVRDTYYLNGTTYSGIQNLAGCVTTCPVSGVTFSRAGSTVTTSGAPFYLNAALGQTFVNRTTVGTYFDASGNLQTAAAGVGRSATYTYNGSSWIANSGTLAEPAETNNDRNNTMVGVTTFSNTQLTTNPTFSGCSATACTGWTTRANSGTGTATYASNTATLTGDGTHAEEIEQTITTVAGTTYAVAVTTGAGSSVTFQAGTSYNGSQLSGGSGVVVPANTTATGLFTATTTTSYIEVSVTSASPGTVTSILTTTVGSLPTNWALSTAGTGLSAQVIGSGTENNINYVDFRWYGTPIASSWPYLSFDSACTAYSVSQNALVTASAFIKLQGGSIANLTSPHIELAAEESGCVYSATPVTTSIGSISSAALSTQRWVVSTTSSTFSDPLTADAISVLRYQATASNAIDVTFRIGMPQLEGGSYATSVIATSGSTYTRTADTYSSPNGGTYFNSAGVLTIAPVNTPRLDYGPTGGIYPLGILIEESRTNSIRNNTMVGVVTGTPGTPPTNWNLAQGGLNGLTEQIVGFGTSRGISYIDVNYSGTTNATSTTLIRPESSSTQITTVSGDTWVHSAYLAIVGGSNANISLQIGQKGYDSGGGALSDIGAETSFAAATATLTRYYSSGTVTDPSAAYAVPFIHLGYNSGAAINITLRIGMPQFENGQGEFNPTSVIPTSGSAITRNQDTLYVQGTANGTWLTNNIGTLGTVGLLVYGKGLNNAGFAGLDDGTANNTVSNVINSSLKKGVTMYVGGASPYSQLTAAYTLGTTTKIVFAFSTNGGGDEGSAEDGALRADGTVAIPATQSELTVGHSRRTDGDLDGYVQRIWYMPTRQPDSTLADYSR